MKRILKYGLLAFFAVTMAFVACTPEEEDVRLDPQMATMSATSITSESAVITGFVIAEGDGYTEKGVCYDISTEPTVDDLTVIVPDSLAKNAQYSVTLTGLDYVTKYYARAYAKGDGSVVYGDTVSFTTLPILPELTTEAVTDITGNSAVTGGNVTNTGGVALTMKGVCWAETSNPTVDDNHTEDGADGGAFTSALTDLKGNTTYYVRAYAINSEGTAYGNELEFTTAIDLPTVTTAAASDITKTEATTGGELVDNGGGTISERGIVWGSTENPTVESDTKIADAGTDIGTFTATITGLDLATEYHVRAFATNEAGTAYGENVTFSTLADITTFFVVGDYNGWDNSDAAEILVSTAENPTAEGYVYLTSGGFKLTTDHSWSDPATFGDDGSGGLTNPGNNIAVAEDGYYLIQANQADMTYSLTKVVWGVVGDATPGGWDTDTPLEYDATSKTLIGGVHFTAANFKFRANNSWDYNYGSTDLVNLVAGGDNIAVSVEADYAITLDLSTPNTYTYVAHRWGLIGAATPGGWDNDTDMTWDAANKVFTVTLNLVAGEFKFRADDDWAVNFGGDIGALTQDGANLSVASDGSYTITLNPWTAVGTITQN